METDVLDLYDDGSAMKLMSQCDLMFGHHNQNDSLPICPIHSILHIVFCNNDTNTISD
jgi:hypothetical protein